MTTAVESEDPKLVINDDFFNKIGGLCSSEGKRLEEVFDNYVDILQDIADEAVKGGDIHKSTVQFIAAARMLKGKAKSISATAKKICGGFVTQVDTDDQELYI